MLRLVLGTVEITTDIDETVKEDEISIYPNPSTGIVNIRNAENKKLVVYNIQGEKIKTLNAVSKIEKIDLSKYTSGSYLIKIDSKTKVIDLIKE